MSQIDWFKKYQENLQQIEAVLKGLGMWSSEPPSKTALESTMPFAVDTMSFEQWVQYIFIPKIQNMIELKQLPPGPAQIHPIAEEVYKEQKNTKPLLDLFKVYDEISYLSHIH